MFYGNPDYREVLRLFQIVRRLLMASSMALVAILLLGVWVMPTIQGPVITCDPSLSGSECDELVTYALENSGRQTMPITSITVDECGGTTVFILWFWPTWIANCGLQ